MASDGARRAAVAARELAHDRRWQAARRAARELDRDAALRASAPPWSFARMAAAGTKAPCRVCGYDRRSRTSGACGWCGCETPGDTATTRATTRARGAS